MVQESSGKKSRGGSRVNHSTTFELIGKQNIYDRYVNVYWLAKCDIMLGFSNICNEGLPFWRFDVFESF